MKLFSIMQQASFYSNENVFNKIQTPIYTLNNRKLNKKVPKALCPR